MRLRLAARQHGRLAWFDHDDANARLAPLQRSRDTARGGCRARAVDEGVDSAVCLAPDLFAQTEIPSDRVGIVELIYPKCVRLAAQLPRCLDHVEDELLGSLTSLARHERDF